MTSWFGSLFRGSESGGGARGFTRRGFEPAESAPVRRSTMLIVLAGVLALLFAVAGTVHVLRPTTLRIAVGPVTSDDAKVVQTITQVLARERGNVRLRVIATSGASESSAALEAGTADLAVVRGDLGLPKSAQAVATLRKNVVALWVPARAKANGSRRGKSPPINKISDLSGRHIGVIGRTPANVALLNVILGQYGIAPDKVTVTQFGTNESAEAARNDKIDVLLAVGPLNSRITAEAVAATSRNGAAPTFLEIEAADTIAQRDTRYESTEIAAGAFGGSPAKPEESIKTIGFSHHIVARQSLSEEVVAAFTRQLFANRQAIVSELPYAASIETPDTDKDAVIPAHPGAAAYVDGDEKTFLDRYSDLIWWSLMGVSAIGSVGAWFASYRKKDERHLHGAQRERLLDMLDESRKAETSEQLDLLQAEADRILRETLRAFDDDAIDDACLTAVNMVLEQLHAAVADRRTLLAAAPIRGPRTVVA